MRWAVVLLVATGCQQIFGLDKPRVIDAATASDVPVGDGAPDVVPGSCMDMWLMDMPMLGAPTAIVGDVNGGAAERYPFVIDTTSATQQVMYYSRDGDLFTARGFNTGFTSSAPESGLNSTANETKVYVRDDLLRAFFASNRPGGEGGYDLWRGFRTDATQPWSVDQMYLAALNDSNGQSDPHLSSDLLRIYYTVGSTTADQRIGGAFRSNASQAFSMPLFSMALDSSVDDMDPTLTEDERVIVFVSLRSGNKELYYATRGGVLQDFGPPKLVPGVNVATAADEHPFITKDGCRLYFTSDRDGTADIFTASMPD